MLLARYFIFVSGALLALLFVVDACLPKLPSAEGTPAAADLSVIRIHSDRKWPERIVIDTSLPMITPATAVMKEVNAAPPARVADLPTKAHVQEAFAQVQPADSRRSKLKQKQRTTARSHIVPPPIRLAQQPRLGFFGFGNSIW